MHAWQNIYLGLFLSVCHFHFQSCALGWHTLVDKAFYGMWLIPQQEIATTLSNTESWVYKTHGQPCVYCVKKICPLSQTLTSSQHFIVLENTDDLGFQKDQSLFERIFFMMQICCLCHSTHSIQSRQRPHLKLVHRFFQSLWWCTLACTGPSTNNRILACIIHPSLICSSSNTCGSSTFMNSAFNTSARFILRSPWYSEWP